jgi:protein TonB
MADTRRVSAQRSDTRRAALPRVSAFIVVAGIHAALLFCLVFRMEISTTVPDPVLPVMKLSDIAEYRPPPPPPLALPPVQNAVENIAETIIETDEVPPDMVVSVAAAPPEVVVANVEEEYLSMSKISVAPVLSEREIRAALVYPSIAQRSGIEGQVILELFIDKEGYVRRISVLQERPAGRGFGEAAVKAFTGLRAKPAEANGEAVAVRYRYPVRFTLR